MTLLEIMIVLAILALVMGLIVGPRVMENHQQAKLNIAMLAVNKLTYEAFPQWATRHPAESCPETIEALSEHMDSKSTKDPWGNHYKLFCPPNLPAGARHIAIMSPGPDGKDGTADDVNSW